MAKWHRSRECSSLGRGAVRRQPCDVRGLRPSFLCTQNGACQCQHNKPREFENRKPAPTLSKMSIFSLVNGEVPLVSLQKTRATVEGKLPMLRIFRKCAPTYFIRIFRNCSMSICPVLWGSNTYTQDMEHQTKDRAIVELRNR